MTTGLRRTLGYTGTGSGGYRPTLRPLVKGFVLEIPGALTVNPFGLRELGWDEMKALNLAFYASCLAARGRGVPGQDGAELLQRTMALPTTPMPPGQTPPPPAPSGVTADRQLLDRGCQPAPLRSGPASSAASTHDQLPLF